MMPSDEGSEAFGVAAAWAAHTCTSVASPISLEEAKALFHSGQLHHQVPVTPGELSEWLKAEGVKEKYHCVFSGRARVQIKRQTLPHLPLPSARWYLRLAPPHCLALSLDHTFLCALLAIATNKELPEGDICSPSSRTHNWDLFSHRSLQRRSLQGVSSKPLLQSRKLRPNTATRVGQSRTVNN